MGARPGTDAPFATPTRAPATSDPNALRPGDLFGLRPRDNLKRPADLDVTIAPMPKRRAQESVARPNPERLRRGQVARFIAAFAIGVAAASILIAVAAVAAFSASSNRVIYGLHIGSTDMSGLGRDEVVSRLQADYANLDQGQAVFRTPVGVGMITYREAGRRADIEAMADAAMWVGHSGNPIDDTVSMLRSAVGGESVPVVIRVDPTAVATRVRELVGANQILARPAQVTAKDGVYSVSKSTPGQGIDEAAVSAAIIDNLLRPDAPFNLQLDDMSVALVPGVTDQDAQAAIAAAQKMKTDVDLTWSDVSSTAGPSPSPTAGPSASPKPSAGPTTFKIDAQTVGGWIVFGIGADGNYGPSADDAMVQAYLSGLATKIGTPPVEPSVVYDATGKPASLAGGKNGTGVDIPATSVAIEDYLEGLASGGPRSTVAMVAAVVSPRITLDSVSGMTILSAGQGAWTTVFFPGESNGNGANIRTPAKLLDGQVVGPGQQFSFLKAVGPIDIAHGYALGGVIEHGKSNHTGAMGGGICSASTTMFNAAARAGLQIDERHQHSYYIDRYPVGLDATVYVNGGQVWDLKWTNDTPNPILIRARATNGSKSKITIELWSLPLIRTVVFSPELKENVVKPADHTQYVTTLKPGQQYRVEYPTAGYDTFRTRTVTDSTGKVLHYNKWISKYEKVDGLLQIGVTPKAPPTPTPTPAAALDAPAAASPYSIGSRTKTGI